MMLPFPDRLEDEGGFRTKGCDVYGWAIYLSLGDEI
jgi:hypothetical protein